MYSFFTNDHRKVESLAHDVQKYEYQSTYGKLETAHLKEKKNNSTLLRAGWTAIGKQSCMFERQVVASRRTDLKQSVTLCMFLFWNATTRTEWESGDVVYSRIWRQYKKFANARATICVGWRIFAKRFDIHLCVKWFKESFSLGYSKEAQMLFFFFFLKRWTTKKSRCNFETITSSARRKSRVNAIY